MIHILEVLNTEFERREKRAKDMWEAYAEMRDRNIELEKQIEILKKDLFELSQEHFKKLSDGKKTNNKKA